jgi:hypothetical protein
VRGAIASVVLVVAAAAVGCSGGTESAGGRLSSAELGWLRAYAAWSIAIYNDDLGPPPGAKLVEACEDRYAELGPPPTERLERVVDQTTEVCLLLGEAGKQRRALDRIDEIDELLLPLLRDEQPLEFGTGTTETSRADLAFSAFATEVAEAPVEVRCWDDSEWRRIVAEDNAWSDGKLDADSLFGWQDESRGRIHLPLETCNLLSRTIAEGIRGMDFVDRMDAANALGTLVHEVRHFVLPDADEATVECAAMRSLERAGVSLGLDLDDAADLARFYREDIYPEQAPEYTAGGCPP